MTTLLLRLAGPLQSWGEDSRSVRRDTEKAPTKSGVLGLLAAAQGRRRTDDIEDLLGLGLAVRIDQQGRVERDFQTSQSLDGSRSYPLTTRYYLADALFLAAVEGDRDLIIALDAALRRPTFPLYLGRRSCPPEGQVTLGVREGSAIEVLEAEPWRASRWWKEQQGEVVDLEMRVDEALVPSPAVADGATVTTTHRDAPISFDPERREYGWRSVVHRHVTVTNDAARVARRRSSQDRRVMSTHEPMAAFGGA